MRVKICGVRSADDALACIGLGADFIGVNLVASSPRSVDSETARAIAEAVRGTGAESIGVVDRVEDVDALLRETALDALQVHGESAAHPRLFLAIRIAGHEDVALARAAGPRVLVDAKVDGVLGGSGQTFDWALVRDLARHREVFLAGGLVPENVARAIAIVRPFAVDVASGVEVSPGVKDFAKVRAFIAAARGA